LTALAQLPDVRVIGRTSAEVAKRSGKAIEAIGVELGVEAVVDGSVRRSADRVRVTVQLLRASDAVGLWTETYERPMGDLFELQAQLAWDVAAALDRRLKAASVAPPTESLAAYDAYLTGRHLMGRQTPESLAAAEEQFERATRSDPDFALAWSGLSDVLSLSWALGFDYGEDVFEVDAALACLEGNIDQPGMYANMYLAQNPAFDSLRDEPRFERVLERAGLAGVTAGL
jgi:hypothetical protein